MMKDSYNKCLKSMYDLRRFGIKLDLLTIKNLLKGLKNPQNTYKTIHVAGTNGKGSISSTLANILYKAGFKVGLYTSPHLVNFNERICINNIPTSDENVVLLHDIVKSIPDCEREPTFFELTTAMALYEFAKEKVDWAVIETGMGGRFDATNIIEPAISIISNISLEHQIYLGNTIAKIASEKGGIIKSNTPVITGVKQKSAILVLNDLAQKHKAPLYNFGKDFKIIRNKSDMFSYYGIENVWKNIKKGLQGQHQFDNAALVLASCEILKKQNLNLSLQNIQEGLLTVKWPGRLEIVSSSPYVILDGAHNLDAMKKLKNFLVKNFSNKKITLVIGILEDKPYKKMLKCILPLCKKLILTKPKIERSINLEKLQDASKLIVKDIMIIPEVKKAVNYAIENATNDEAVCITGSLYVIGEAKQTLEYKKTNDNKEIYYF